ncbi:MAG: flagellar export protein FliJ [Pseudomonadota bacterium]
MSRDRVKRLAPVQRFASTQADEAGAELASAERILSEHRQTLHELIQYRGGYATTSAEPGRWQGQHWQDYNEFLTKLDAAIAAQQDVIEQQQLRCHALRSVWQQKRARAESLKQLRARLRSVAEQQALVREQKADDELAAQRHGRVPFAG